MERRGQGISLNVIIIAAISLVVLVILVALVFRSGGDIQRGATACESLGTSGQDYACEGENAGCADGWIVHPTRSCDDSSETDPEVCCVPLGS